MDPVMTVEDLIIALGEFPADAPVQVVIEFDGDPVVGVLSGATLEGDVVTLSA